MFFGNVMLGNVANHNQTSNNWPGSAKKCSRSRVNLVSSWWTAFDRRAISSSLHSHAGSACDLLQRSVSQAASVQTESQIILTPVWLSFVILRIRMPSDIRILIPNLDKWEDQDISGHPSCWKWLQYWNSFAWNFTIVDFPVNQPRQSGDNFHGTSQDLGFHHLWRRNWKLGFRFLEFFGRSSELESIPRSLDFAASWMIMQPVFCLRFDPRIFGRTCFKTSSPILITNPTFSSLFPFRVEHVNHIYFEVEPWNHHLVPEHWLQNRQ